MGGEFDRIKVSKRFPYGSHASGDFDITAMGRVRQSAAHGVLLILTFSGFHSFRTGTYMGGLAAYSVSTPSF